MNEPSPPVRITRARAAAKSDPKLNVATASSKAAKTPKPTTTSTKRKTRADDAKEDDHDELSVPKETMKEIIEPEAPKTRGRPKRAAGPQQQVEVEEAAPKTTRGRPKKTPVEAPVTEATRTTRGRAKKVEDVNTAEDEIVVAEPVKRATRGRAAPATKSAAPKKTVKFEEPDKENVVPAPANAKGKAKEDVATGLRAKPIRKPATTTARATRGRGKVEDKGEKPSPLSPKKITQIATAKDNSDDELATIEKTPMKPLMKSPMKPPGSLFNSAKKLDFTNASISVHKATVPQQDMTASMMASPARRPPQSPFKDALKASPQRLVFGDSMMQSPFKPSFPAPKSAVKTDMQASLLQSPARRPHSPTKVAETGSPSKQSRNISAIDQTPKATPFKISRFATPRTITRTPGHGALGPLSALKAVPTTVPEATETASIPFSGRLSSIMPREVDPTFESSEAIVEENQENFATQDLQASEPMILDEMTGSTETHDTTTPPHSPHRSTGDVDGQNVHQNAAFCLREENESPFDDSDSEDELASSNPRYSQSPLSHFKVSAHDFASSPATPTPLVSNQTPEASLASKRAARRSQIGFTPLAQQLSNWMAASPESDKSDDALEEHPSPLRSNPMMFAAPEAVVQPSPAKSSFFEDEMSVRDGLVAAEEEMGQQSLIIEEDPNFSPVELLEEDLDLAAEADELSFFDPEAVEAEDAIEDFVSAETVEPQDDVLSLPEPADDNACEESIDSDEFCLIEAAENQAIQETFEEHLQKDIPDDTAAAEGLVHDSGRAPSEASEEYGDENAAPIGPTLDDSAATPRPAFSTPKRVLSERVCHTVSKVPLKAPAEDFPMKGTTKKRSASISRLPVSRPSSNLSRSNTVISYSPSKSTPRKKAAQATLQDLEMTDAPATPSRPESVDWSTVGTPARTPRRDLNPALLKGAVVFVDVHTSEGADASVLFTELLTQMGARCVKSWNWSANKEEGSKIGITHIVFKDGGKRTIEKARETGGVVACVGVGWVLDCERENKWLDEASYAVDTTEVPRGGHRRRKSMEPRALANLNGTLTTPSSKTPVRNASPSKEFYNPPETPGTSKSVRRRESVQWIRSPASSNSNEDQLDEQTMALSPIPATPAPETLSAYGEAYLETLNAGGQTPGAETPYFLHKEKLVQMTAPPKQKFAENGSGVLSDKKDESVMMRLMAARRKSLQWAPKVGSPLAKGGEWGS